ncbi:MAG: hypothetical protein HZB30_07735 [Nitrospirae bacterium]|nr:hypothetical protein [Nitrospirota bacterium]
MKITDSREQQNIKKAEKIYKVIAEVDKHLAEDFLSICAVRAIKYKAAGKANKIFYR